MSGIFFSRSLSVLARESIAIQKKKGFYLRVDEVFKEAKRKVLQHALPASIKGDGEKKRGFSGGKKGEREMGRGPIRVAPIDVR